MNKVIDKTHLPIQRAEERKIMHRDYLAHALRWDKVIKDVGAHLRRCSGNELHLLDVGCGKDLPLACGMYSNRVFPTSYTGIDVNKLELPKMLQPSDRRKPLDIRLMGKTDFLDFGGHEQKYDLITSFEVLEHVDSGHAVELLRHMKRYLKDDGKVYISTPVYSEKVGAAANHINEMTRDALGSVIENLGFSIEENFGCFASWRDVKGIISERYGAQGLQMAEDIRAYSGNNVFANLVAPAIPEHSRNNFWVLGHADDQYARKFPALDDIPKPWSCSKNENQLKQSEEK